MKLAPTPAQLGDGTLHGSHAIDATPPLVTTSLDEYPGTADLPLPSSVRSFRGRQSVNGQGYEFPDSGGMELAAGGGIMVAEHGPDAPVNPRQLVGGYPIPYTDELMPEAELLLNSRAPGLDDRMAAPDRTRAGSTGADPHRPSSVPRWLFMRLFDQGIAQRLGEQKVAFASPLASQPIQHDADTVGGIPMVGGAGATGMQPVYAQPNSFRLIPQPWDEQIVNTGGPAAGSMADPAQAASARQAGRSFRL